MTRAEFVARCWAARKMGLIKDPRGVLLPDDLWRQALPDAEFLIETLQQWELFEAVARYYEAEDE